MHYKHLNEHKYERFVSKKLIEIMHQIVNILQVGSEDIWISSSNIPFDMSEVWKESFLPRSKDVASYIPTNLYKNHTK